MRKIKIKSTHTIPVNLSPLGGGILGSSRPGRAPSACQSLLTGTSGLPERCRCPEVCFTGRTAHGAVGAERSPSNAGPPTTTRATSGTITVTMGLDCSDLGGPLGPGELRMFCSLLSSSILCSATSLWVSFGQWGFALWRFGACCVAPSVTLSVPQAAWGQEEHTRAQSANCSHRTLAPV